MQGAQSANDIASAVVVLIGLVITFVMGGGLSFLFDMIPAWKNWSSPLKGYIIIFVSILIGALLASVRVLASVEFFAQLPDAVLAGIGFAIFSLTALFGTQVAYRKLQ